MKRQLLVKVDDQLFKDFKIAVTIKGETIRAVIERAMRDYLSAPAPSSCITDPDDICPAPQIDDEEAIKKLVQQFKQNK